MSYRLPLIALALAATTTAVAAAQDAPRPASHEGQMKTPPQAPGATPMRRGETGLNRMLTGITLTPQQRVRIDSIHARHMAAMPQHTPGTPVDSATRALARTHIEAEQRDVRAVLTAEQQQVWDKNVAAARARMQSQMQGHDRHE